MVAESWGERGQACQSSITGRRHYAFATVRQVRQLEPRGVLADRALIDFDLDEFAFGFCDYGPASLRVGQRAEVYEFQYSGRDWLIDYVLLPT